MGKLIHAQIFVDDLSMPAYWALTAAIEFAENDRHASSYHFPLDDFCRRAHLPVKASSGKVAKIVEEASRAAVEFTGVNTDQLDMAPQHIGCWLLFDKVELTSTHLHFEICHPLFFEGVYFSGFWRSQTITTDHILIGG